MLMIKTTYVRTTKWPSNASEGTAAQHILRHLCWNTFETGGGGGEASQTFFSPRYTVQLNKWLPSLGLGVFKSNEKEYSYYCGILSPFVGPWLP